MQNFYKRLVEERERLGFKKGDIARAGGVANSTYTKYEDGSRVPDAEFLAAIAAAGADVQYILTGIRAGGTVTEPANSYNALNRRERDLIDNYRHIADEEGRRYVEKSALLAVKADQDETQSRTKKRA